MDNIASGEDVDAINQNLEDITGDLQDFLASNNIYSADLRINSEATLEFAQEIKSKLRIVNGNVFIEANSEMDAVALQEIVDNIKTITGDLVVRASSSSAPAITLDSLTGVGDIKIAQAGDISFASLKSVKNLVLGNNYESKMRGSVSFPELTQVSKIQTGDIGDDSSYTVAKSSPTGKTITNDGIILEKATNVDFGALPYYTPRVLKVTAAKGATLNFAALKSVDANGKERSYTITVTGGQEFKVPGLTAGKVTVSDVTTLDLQAFKGEVNAGTGVENIKLGALAKDLGPTATDLITAEITADAADKSIDFSDAAKLQTVTIDGKIKSVTLTNNSDLESLTISAALESLTISNTALQQAALDYTNSNLAEKGKLVVTGNGDLTSFSADNVDGLATLTITGNDDLETISFAALKTAPTKDGKASVTVGGAVAPNALNAADINQDAAGSADGTFVTNSGIDGLKDYLDAVLKNSASSVKVYFDSADDFTDGTTTLTNLKITTAGEVGHLTVVDRDSSAGATKSKRAFLILNPRSHSFVINGNTLAVSTTNSTTADYIASISATDVVNAADAYGAVLTSSAYGQPEAQVISNLASNINLFSKVTSATTKASAQYVSLQLNKAGKTDAEYKATIYLSTAAITDLTASSIGSSGNVHVSQLTVDAATTVASVTQALANAFPTGTASTDGAYTVTVSSTAASATLLIAAKDKSPKFHARGIVAKSSASLGLGDSSGNLQINKTTTADDTMIGTLPVVILESKIGGAAEPTGLSTIGDPGKALASTAGNINLTGVVSGTDFVELTKNSSNPQDADDSPDYTNYGAESSTGAGNTDRTAWL